MLPSIYAYLHADATVLALLGTPGGLKAYRDTAPQGVEQPYVVWFQTGGLPENYMDQRPTIDSGRFQFDITGHDQSNVDAIYNAIIPALETHGYLVGENMSGYDRESKLFFRSFDFHFWTPRS